MLKKITHFLKDESGGDPVVWIVLIIIGVFLAVTIWKYLGKGVGNAAKSMGNALSGQ